MEEINRKKEKIEVPENKIRKYTEIVYGCGPKFFKEIANL
jgi:hypothetical protein